VLLKSKGHIEHLKILKQTLKLNVMNTRIEQIILPTLNAGNCMMAHNCNGKLDGLSRGWYANGQLQWESNFSNGKLVWVKEWDESGEQK
jgi:antitoxin component YwqK of YwqJK toxin-antitoxin module